MSYNPIPALGQATSANSSPVVIASDQSNVGVSVNAASFQFSALGVNSSTTQLAAGATFNGTIEAVPNQPSLSVLMTSDQPITLVVNQYIDAAGTYAVPPITYYVNAGSGISYSIPLNGNYVKVQATNTGSVTTTTFDLNVAYGTIPAADSSGRTPVSEADCVQLLNATISSVGTSASVDSQGFSALVFQITGQWVGNAYFESSVDGVSWNKCFNLPDGTLGLEHTLSGNGQFIVRPAGRYVHLNVSSINGTLTVKALGRTTSVISADQMVSLAMDRRNESPLYTELNPATISKLAPQQTLQQVGLFNLVTGVVPINTSLVTIDCLNLASITLQYSIGTTGLVTPQWSHDGNTWNTATVYSQSGSTSSSINGSGLIMTNVLSRYFRFYLTTATTSGNTQVIAYGSPQLMLPPISTQTVSGNLTTVSTVTTVTTVTTVSTVTAVSALNAINGSTVTNNLTPNCYVSTNTNNLTVMKASAGRLYLFQATNVASTGVAYLKVYNSASVTMGTTSPVFNIALNPLQSVNLGINDLGVYFSSGISFAITSSYQLLDNTAMSAAASVLVNYAYA